MNGPTAANSRTSPTWLSSVILIGIGLLLLGLAPPLLDPSAVLAQSGCQNGGDCPMGSTCCNGQCVQE